MVDCKAVRHEQRTIAGKTFSVSVVPRVKQEGPPKKVVLSLKGLLQGMWLTLTYLVRPKTVVTQQYPENRDTLTFPERYRAALRFKLVPSDDAKRHREALERAAQRLNANVESLERAIRQDQKPVMYHKCTGCGSCEAACPNGSIQVHTRYSEITEDREIDRFIWRMDSCLYCNACVQACPFDAIEMSHGFENAVYDRRLLVYNLNQVAGPPVNAIELEDDPEIRRKMIDPRERYGGPVPMNGHPLPYLRPLDLQMPAVPVNGKSKLREAEA
jgi:NADH-quinone oxidoreductase subunit I